MAKFAAALLEAHEDDLVFQDGTISVKGSPASGRSFERTAFSYVPVPLGRTRARRTTTPSSSLSTTRIRSVARSR
jgi:hypothetical protein